MVDLLKVVGVKVDVADITVGLGLVSLVFPPSLLERFRDFVWMSVLDVNCPRQSGVGQDLFTVEAFFGEEASSWVLKGT